MSAIYIEGILSKWIWDAPSSQHRVIEPGTIVIPVQIDLLNMSIYTVQRANSIRILELNVQQSP